MKKTLLTLLLAVLAWSCGRDADGSLVGRYDAVMESPLPFDSTDLNSIMTAAYLEMVTFEFVFNKDNTCESTMFVDGGGSETIRMKWTIEGDSVILKEGDDYLQAYHLRATENGFEMKGDDALFTLTRKH